MGGTEASWAARRRTADAKFRPHRNTRVREEHPAWEKKPSHRKDKREKAGGRSHTRPEGSPTAALLPASQTGSCPSVAENEDERFCQKCGVPAGAPPPRPSPRQGQGQSLLPAPLSCSPFPCSPLLTARLPCSSHLLTAPFSCSPLPCSPRLPCSSPLLTAPLLCSLAHCSPPLLLFFVCSLKCYETLNGMTKCNTLKIVFLEIELK